MSGKLAIGGLVAVAAMALSAGTASAQRVVQHGNHFHTVSPAYGHGGFYAPSVYRPVYTPVYAPVYTSGFGYGAYPGLGYTSGFGFNTPNLYRGGYGGYPGYGYGGGFNTVNFGVYRPGFGMNLGFVIR